MINARHVAIYRRLYLPPSETFVADHVEGLRNWTPHPVCKEADKSPLANDRQAFKAVTPGFGRLKWSVMRELGFNPRLSRHLRECRVSMLHAHFLHDAADIVRFAVKSRLPLVVTAHGYDATEFPQHKTLTPEGRDYLSRQSEIHHHAAAIVCVSDFIRAELEARGFRRDLLRTIRLGVDLERLSRFDTRMERSGVLFVGRMVEKKGAHLLLEAWRHLPPEHREVPLTFIGDGPLRKELESLGSRAGANVIFRGYASRDETLSAMASASLLAVPSVRAANGDAEGLPVVVMEAQSLGTPVVCFDEGPMPESIVDGETGLVAGRRNPRDLAAKISLLLGDAQMRSRMGENAKDFASSRYDLRRNIRDLESLYDEVASRPIASRSGSIRTATYGRDHDLV